LEVIVSGKIQDLRLRILLTIRRFSSKLEDLSSDARRLASNASLPEEKQLFLQKQNEVQEVLDYINSKAKSLLSESSSLSQRE